MRLLIVLLFAVAACHKDSRNDCSQLAQAISQNNIEEVKELVNDHIDQLVARDHTQQNLERLIASLQQCGIDAQLQCFACIKTLPEQSEIRLPHGRVIDIMAVSVTNNTMKCFNMH